ncbi:pentatricopeptide repeat-containing protein At2g13600-like [Rhodamnia argentea]|uniref:Pentatricopeptide repeat-containing protein At2g13600-like n=1 Tax=Rhodamnia argentea TaxID=178133 RepID=A0A8B8NGJ1_9MYRT|nr:pentatricopeptide repeat-containing protein At2g13600-like [Rhodamnia argentea]XP_048138905.1 pentatricopeptide repeat-containing protein At2g13600-like [Rhodamnia argentea]
MLGPTFHRARRSLSNHPTVAAVFPPTDFQKSAAEEEEELYSREIHKCARTSDLRNGRAIHAPLLKGSVPFSLFLKNQMLNAYLKCGSLESGLRLFEEMPERNVVSWSALITGFVQQGRPEGAISLFRRMNREGTARPNEFTLVSTLHACSLLRESGLAHQVYAQVVRLGFEWNVYLINAFSTALIRNGRLLEAMEVFEKCQLRDIVSWNAIMAGYLELSYAEVPWFWGRMIREGEVKPNHYTFSSVLTALASLSDIEMGLQVHAQLVKCGHGSDICVGNSLVGMYVKNLRLDEGFRAFGEMCSRNVLSWTQMAAGCLLCGEPGKALEVFAEMRKAGILPNEFTLSTALNACANIASLEEGVKIHGVRIKLGSDVDICAANALIDMYMKCGCVDAARGVFQSMREHSVVSWTTMIIGCAQNGQAREALKFFDEMIEEGAQPNDITFVCVLDACSQGGFVDEGWKYFSSMSQHHGISPREDHYACMVNLLGRNGQIKQAEGLILSMPFQPGVLIWQTLLGAALFHGDMETAKRASDHALKLDRKDPSTYVLLSNMFAGLRNWDGVGMMRELMETSDVRKLPGSSWIVQEKGGPPALADG